MSSIHVNEIVRLCVCILFLHFVTAFLNSGRQHRWTKIFRLWLGTPYVFLVKWHCVVYVVLYTDLTVEDVEADMKNDKFQSVFECVVV